MYQYVKDKEFLKESYSICADVVNQLVQNLKSYGIESRMSVVGSKKRGLVTQNEGESIDYDFNLWITSADNLNNPRELKPQIMAAFNEVLKRKGWQDCEDSASAMTTKKNKLEKGNKTPFSIDVCIVKEDGRGNWYRLFHQKTGWGIWDQYYWVQGPLARDIQKKEQYLKPNYWTRVREVYLNKKNMYLVRQELDNHPSYNCYIEAINEVYDQVKREESLPLYHKYNDKLTFL